MDKGNAIEVKDVKKKFRVYFDKGNQLKERLLFRSRNRYEDRWVLNGISFNVKKGEAVGLIGHNGCGKSTTLKLLTRIMYPTEGTIELSGRVSSLIELGAGFHPDMSGRENIYTNASIFGLTKKEIDERMDDIVEFSEMEQFLDNPVRTYSSGMYMRLAFSVAINVNADILLIDEILAVGDINFQAKCFNKLKEIKAQGTTIVIVSHSLGQIEQICDRTIWIDGGKIKADGKPRDVHPEYMDFMGQKRQVIAEKENARKEEKSGKKAGERGEDAESGESGEDKKRWGNGHARI
ncbi:ABC transporter ATP-binding protein, partial [Catenibacillus scindens]